MPWTGVKTSDDERPFVAPDDIWIILRRFCETLTCFSFFWAARSLPPSLFIIPKSRPMESSPYSAPRSCANARLFIWIRSSVGRVFSFAFRTRRPPLFFLPVMMSGGGSALTFCALGGSHAFSILPRMSWRKPSAADVSCLVESFEKASRRTASDALDATSFSARFRSTGGAACTRSAKYSTPVCGMPAVIPKPARCRFSCPMTVRLHAGTCASFSRPPAIPTSIAASDEPTRCVRFGASTDMRDWR
mmetsp:Transcript_34653/g.107158  ORF Transcript_34653/g.107158 Transcript_34653/m.107158 type:complete len:247 (+) Transcript_34653:169-909(+)